MCCASRTARSHVYFVRIGFRVSYELWNAVCRNRWIDQHHASLSRECRDRHDVAKEVEIKIVIECRVPRIRRRSCKQGVTVRTRTHDSFGREIAAGARPVLDNELLAE